jgi:hypothetical protein
LLFGQYRYALLRPETQEAAQIDALSGIAEKVGIPHIALKREV